MKQRTRRSLTLHEHTVERFSNVSITPQSFQISRDRLSTADGPFVGPSHSFLDSDLILCKWNLLTRLYSQTGGNFHTAKCASRRMWTHARPNKSLKIHMNIVANEQPQLHSVRQPQHWLTDCAEGNILSPHCHRDQSRRNTFIQADSQTKRLLLRNRVECMVSHKCVI